MKPTRTLQIKSQLFLPVTVIALYAFCPRLVYKKYVQNQWIEHSSPERALGCFYHEYRRRLNTSIINNKNILDQEKIATRSLLESFKYASNEYPQYPKSIDDYFLKIQSRIPFDLDDLNQDPPIQSEFYITSSSYGLNGIIDLIIRDEINNTIIPVDYKTGKLTGSFKEYNRIQILIYCLLLDTQNNTKPRYGLIDYVDLSFKDPVIYNKKSKTEVIRKINEVFNMIQNEIPPTWFRPTHEHLQLCTTCQDFRGFSN